MVRDKTFCRFTTVEVLHSFQNYVNDLLIDEIQKNAPHTSVRKGKTTKL